MRGTTGVTGAAVFFVCLLVCAWIYWPGLSGPLLLDDHPQLGPLLNGDVALEHEWPGLLNSSSGPLGRPVSMLTFLFNAVTSGPDTVAWKRANLMLHLLVGLLLFWLAAHLVCPERLEPTGRCWATAALLAAIWILHPLHVSTVLYTVQRMAQLSTLFLVAGLITYVIGRKRQIADRPAGSRLLFLAFVLFFPLAALSKENGLLFPVLALLLEMAVLHFQGGPARRRALMQLYGLFLLLPLLSGVGYVAAHWQEVFTQAYLGRDFSMGERILTQPRVLMLYLYQILIPIQRNMGFFHDDIAPSMGWLDPPSTLVSFLVIGVLLGLALASRRRQPLLAFGILLFLGSHLLESTIIPLELAFEHRNYLGVFGIVLAGYGALRAVRFNPTLVATMSGVVLLTLTGLTALRAQTWSSARSMTGYFYRAHPASARASALLAEQLTGQGQLNAALAVLSKLDSSGARLHRMYIRCLRYGALADAELASLQKNLSSPINDYTSSGLMEVAGLGLDGRCVFSAEQYISLLDATLNLVIREKSTRYKLNLYRAYYLARAGQLTAALDSINRAGALYPDNPVPRFVKADLYIALGAVAEARLAYNTAVELAKAATERHKGFQDYMADYKATDGMSANTRRAFGRER